MKTTGLIFYLLTITTFVCALIYKETFWDKTIIFKDWNIKSFINNKVERCCIIHSKIVCFPMFTDSLYSHWMPGLFDSFGHLVCLSTAASGSIVVRSLLVSNLKRISSEHQYFVDNHSWIYIIRDDQIFPTKRSSTITFADAIQLFSKTHVFIKYNLFTTNCQYQTIRFINSITDAKLKNHTTGLPAFNGCIHEILSPDKIKFKAKALKP